MQERVWTQANKAERHWTDFPEGGGGASKRGCGLEAHRMYCCRAVFLLHRARTSAGRDPERNLFMERTREATSRWWERRRRREMNRVAAWQQGTHLLGRYKAVNPALTRAVLMNNS